MSTTGATDLGHEAQAIYLPAISASYAVFALNGSFSRPLPVTAQQLDFLRPQQTTRAADGRIVPLPGQPLFHYPYALYSAGQAAKTDKQAMRDSMVSKRDPHSTLVLGDSGGYQVLTGTIKFQGVRTTERMLRWMERNADYSMILDFPTAGISGGTITQYRPVLAAAGQDINAMSAANGQSLDFNVCLALTMLNNDYFVQHQSNKTKFLNVLQGRHEDESRVWYEAVKHYPFDGWAFSDSNQNHFSLVLRRLMDLRRDGLLAKIKWLHILGIATLPLACLFTTVQDCIRKYDNPDLQISFDSASPFRMAAFNQVVFGYTISRDDWNIHSDNIVACGQIGDATLLNDFAWRPGTAPVAGRHHVATGVGSCISIADILAKQPGKSPVDKGSAYLLMNHNTEAFLRAHLHAQRIYAEGDPLTMTHELLCARNLIEYIFREHDATGAKIDPYELINAGQELLDKFGA